MRLPVTFGSKIEKKKIVIKTVPFGSQMAD